MPDLSHVAMENAFRSTEAAVAWFGFSTVVFLLLCGAVFRRSRTVPGKLIALGILTAVVSVNYGAFCPPTVMPMSAGLLKIALILVLGGVACSVITTLGITPGTESVQPKEAANER